VSATVGVTVIYYLRVCTVGVCTASVYYDFDCSCHCRCDWRLLSVSVYCGCDSRCVRWVCTASVYHGV